MDCDDVMLLLAAGESRALASGEHQQLHRHVADCEACRALAVETTDERLRWAAGFPAADSRVLALLEEQGRNELMAGDRERALAYLAAAYRGGRDGVAMRHLLAAATRDLELHDHAIEPRRNEITSIGFLDGGRVVTVYGMDSATIAIWNGASQIAAHPVGGCVLASRLSPDARRAAVVLDGNQLAVYDTTTGSRAWQVADPAADQPTLVFDPAGGSLVVVTTATRRLRGAQLRDAATGELRATLIAGAGPPVAAAFSPDGRLVATCGEDGAVGVWMTRTGKLVATSRFARALTAIAFAGSARLVIGSEEGDARIWQFAGPDSILLAGHYGAITAIAAREDPPPRSTSSRAGSGGRSPTACWCAPAGDVRGRSSGACRRPGAVLHSTGGELTARRSRRRPRARGRALRRQTRAAGCRPRARPRGHRATRPGSASRAHRTARPAPARR